jgi:hypothetical protein
MAIKDISSKPSKFNIALKDYLHTYLGYTREGRDIQGMGVYIG